MRDPNIRFSLDAKTLDRLQAIAEQRGLSLSMFLRSLVYAAVYPTTRKETGTDEQQEAV